MQTRYTAIMDSVVLREEGKAKYIPTMQASETIDKGVARENTDDKYDR